MDAKPFRIEVELYTQFGAAGRKIGGPKVQDARGVDGSPHLLAIADCWTNQVNLYHNHKGEIQYHTSMKVTGEDGVMTSPRDVALMADKVLVVDGTANIKVFDSHTGEMDRTYLAIKDPAKASKSRLDGITASPDGTFFLVADKDKGQVTTHSLTAGLLRTLDVGMSPGFISNFGGHLAASDHETGKVRLFDIESGSKVTEFDAPNVRGISFHPETRSIVAACSEGLFGSGFLRQYCMGMLVGQIADGLYFPQGMSFLSQDKLAVADKTTAKIFRLTRY